MVSLIHLEQPDHAYFFGFAQTDGHLHAGVGQKGRLEIEVSVRDDSVLRGFSELFPVYSSTRYRDRTTNFGRYRSAVWAVCDLAFRRELAELGFLRGGSRRPSLRRTHPSVLGTIYAGS